MNTAMQNVLGRIAPRLNYARWDAALTAGFEKFGINTPKRQAMAVGQFLVEAGDTFGSTRENCSYSSAEHLMAIFPSHFPTIESTGGYLNNPVALANYVYANREGNGGIATGDGWRWRGGGLIDITFRDTYVAFAKAMKMDLSDVELFINGTAGAAMAGCWFLEVNGCLPLADEWDIEAVTRKVAGPSMGFAFRRETYSNYLRQALEYAEANP